MRIYVSHSAWVETYSTRQYTCTYNIKHERFNTTAKDGPNEKLFYLLKFIFFDRDEICSDSVVWCRWCRQWDSDSDFDEIPRRLLIQPQENGTEEAQRGKLSKPLPNGIRCISNFPIFVGKLISEVRMFGFPRFLQKLMKMREIYEGDFLFYRFFIIFEKHSHHFTHFSHYSGGVFIEQLHGISWKFWTITFTGCSKVECSRFYSYQTWNATVVVVVMMTCDDLKYLIRVKSMQGTGVRKAI